LYAGMRSSKLCSATGDEIAEIREKANLTQRTRCWNGRVAGPGKTA
jgi:hypothetical protein